MNVKRLIGTTRAQRFGVLMKFMLLLYLGSFIAVGKLFVLILGFGVPFSIWDYLADRRFYRMLVQ